MPATISSRADLLSSIGFQQRLQALGESALPGPRAGSGFPLLHQDRIVDQHVAAAGEQAETATGSGPGTGTRESRGHLVVKLRGGGRVVLSQLVVDRGVGGRRRIHVLAGCGCNLIGQGAGIGPARSPDRSRR
jgi:hypothetical protein